MKCGSIWLVQLLLTCCPSALKAQFVYSVSNSASYLDSNLPGYGIAQGSIMVLFGSQMGPLNWYKIRASLWR